LENLAFLSPKIGSMLKLPEAKGIFDLQKIVENYFWEFPFGKNMFHLSQVPFEGAEGGLAA